MATISSITLYDFKKFSHFSVSCRGSNVLVGPNNAGKFSILDALRILVDLIRFSRREGPRLMEHASVGVCATYLLPSSAISVPLANIVRNYGDDPARIEFKLSNGRTLYVQLHPTDGVSAFLSSDGPPPRTDQSFRSAVDIGLVVVPTLSSLEDEENWVTDPTVRKNENTRLASRNFRNIVLRLDPHLFDQFQNLCSRGWSDIEVHRPMSGRQLTMMFSENRIQREVHWSGFGFQVWMQMMLQFVRASSSSILVLDEPDIYLHPDLQRRLMHVARELFGQVFVATHSTELINDADPGDVLMIEAKGRSARRITSDEGYRRVYAYLGSSENAEFARIAKAKRIVFFEGKERNLIRKLARKCGKAALLDDPYTIYLQAGGYSQWRRIREVNWALHEIFGVDAKLGALFDRDYRCDEEVAEFEDDLSTPELWVGVLRRKEIENYALNLQAVQRTLHIRLDTRGTAMSDAEMLSMVSECTEGFLEESRAQLSAMYLSHFRTHRKDIDDSQHIRDSMRRFDERWSDLSTRLTIIPGKAFISTLSTMLQSRYGVAITIHQIVEEMESTELDTELVAKLESLSKFFAE